MKQNRKAGFTLAELLIVVAIIGVLAAVAVPVFAGTLEKSRETVCLHNRIVLQRDLMYDAMMEQIDFRDFDAEQLRKKLEIAENKDSAHCPTGGKYMVKVDPKTGSITVGCKEHTDSGMTNQTMAESSMQDFLNSYKGKTDQSSILKAYHEYIKDHNNGKPYTVSQDELLSLFEPTPKGYPPSLQDMPKDAELIWMPVRLYWDGKPHDVSVATSTAIFDGNNVCRGYMFCYEGQYYRTTNVSGNGKGYNLAYLTSTSSDGDKYDSLDALIAGKGKWEKVP